MHQSIIIKFRIAGSLRFISHQEMMRAWERCLIRAGISLAFSEGFNPHPRISLPLPRGVGLESDDELISILIETGEGEQVDINGIARQIADQLPRGIDITEAAVKPGRTAIHADGAVFVIPVSGERAESARSRSEEILSEIAAGNKLPIDRKDEHGYLRTINAAEYIDTIKINENNKIEVKYKITQGGSIRVDEVLGLLGLGSSVLEGPVKRTAVQWKYKA